MLVLAILFALGGAFLLWRQASVHRSIVERSALESAKAYSEALATFRTLYTRDVVEVVRKLAWPISARMRWPTIPLAWPRLPQ